MGQGLSVKRLVNRVVARIEFFSELCEVSQRTLRLEALEALDLRAKSRDFDRRVRKRKVRGAAEKTTLSQSCELV